MKWMSNFKEGFFKFVEEDIAVNSHLWLTNDDVLFQRGNSIDYVGIAAVYHGLDGKYIYPDLMIKIRLYSELRIAFFHQYMISQFGRKHFKGKASGTAGTMPKISQGAITDFLIPLPPLAEQQAIVERATGLFGKVDELTERLNAARQVAGRLRQAVLREAFSPQAEGVTSAN